MSNWPTGYLTAGRLKERGWTEGLIKKFMPEPCKTMTNRVYRSKPPYRLYGEARVAGIETTKDWKEAAAIAAGRRKAALIAAETKRAELMAAIDRLEIEVPQMGSDKLIQLACDNYNRHKLDLFCERGYEFTPATKDSAPQFLERISVNYLRHELTNYETLLARTYGKVGVREAYYEIAKKVYSAIASAYPHLLEECDRQLRRKGAL
jgi:hypothetical protein